MLRRFKINKHTIAIHGLLLCLGMSEARASTKIVRLHSTPYTFENLPGDKVRIKMEGFGTVSRPGHPGLPIKTYLISLPPEAKVLNVSIHPAGPEYLAERYDVEAAKPLLPSDGNAEATESVMFEYRRTRERLYSTDGYLPEAFGAYLGLTYEGDRPKVRIRYSPFAYHPVKKQLCLSREIEIHIEYEASGSETGESEASYAYDSLLEFDDSPRMLNKQNSTSSLLVIASETLSDAVEPFLFWKTCIGYRVEYVTAESIYASMEGQDRAEQIRNFLKAKVAESSIENVLFIGHTDIIPIKKLYPDPSKLYAAGAVPSDFYFAELTSDWDSDGDGYPGEFGQDNVDWTPELNIGRIPWSDHQTVSQILEKTIQYEKTAGNWKEQALLIGAMNNYKYENNDNTYFDRTDGATLMELLRQKVFQGGPARTLYEKEGVEPSHYASDMALNRETLFSSWTQGSYGCITWWTHGKFNKITRKWWRSDDGDAIPESGEIVNEIMMSTYDYPTGGLQSPIIFANACDNGWPEKTSLGRQLIKDGCTGIVSSSRISWYVLGWDDVCDGGNASLTYFFWDEFIKSSKGLGGSNSRSKLAYFTYFHDSWHHFQNVYAYNLLGDPTLRTEKRNPQYGGVAGVVVSDDQNGTPVEGAEVEIMGTSCRATTDEKGRFNMYGVPGGTRLLVVKKDSFLSKELNVAVVNGEKTEVNVGLAGEMAENPTPISIDEPSSRVASFYLEQNYPNPFNSQTSIRFALPCDAEIIIRVYNLSGKLVRELVNERIRAGNHIVTWDGNDENGYLVASGIYHYEFVSPAYRKVRSLCFIK